jgi:hypothetical protein
MLYDMTKPSSPVCLTTGPVVETQGAMCVSLPGGVMVCESDPLGAQAKTVDSDDISAVCSEKTFTLNVCGSGRVLVKDGDGYVCQKVADDAKPETAMCMSYVDNKRSACSENDMIANSAELCELSKQLRLLIDEQTGNVQALCGTFPGSDVVMCKFYGVPTTSADELEGLCRSRDQVGTIDADGSFQCVDRDEIMTADSEDFVKQQEQGDDEADEEPREDEADEEPREDEADEEGLTIGDVKAAEGEEALIETEADMDSDMDLGAEEQMLDERTEPVRPPPAPVPTREPTINRNKFMNNVQIPPFGTSTCPAVNYGNRYGLGSSTYSGSENYATSDVNLNSVQRCAPTETMLRVAY